MGQEMHLQGLFWGPQERFGLVFHGVIAHDLLAMTTRKQVQLCLPCHLSHKGFSLEKTNYSTISKKQKLANATIQTDMAANHSYLNLW